MISFLYRKSRGKFLLPPPGLTDTVRRGAIDDHGGWRTVQVDGSGTAGGCLPVQLRGPAGDLLGVPAAQGGDAPERRATGVRRVVVHVGVRGGGAVRRHGGRPLPAEARYSWRADFLVAHHGRHLALHALLAPGGVSGAGGIGGGLLLSGIDVVDQCVAREGDAVARDVVASIQRLCGNHHGRGGGRISGAALRMAPRVLRVRLAGCPAGWDIAVSAERAGNRGCSRGGHVPLFRRVAGGVDRKSTRL